MQQLCRLHPLQRICVFSMSVQQIVGPIVIRWPPRSGYRSALMWRKEYSLVLRFCFFSPLKFNEICSFKWESPLLTPNPVTTQHNTDTINGEIVTTFWNNVICYNSMWILCLQYIWHEAFFKFTRLRRKKYTLNTCFIIGK